MANHIREVEFTKDGKTYSLEIDTEDSDNLILESVTLISGPKSETDIDPNVFAEDLEDDDWLEIHKALDQ